MARTAARPTSIPKTQSEVTVTTDGREVRLTNLNKVF